jgi:3-hydroxyisobutyrate dehydrogenase-like beta-hydroxyacid dehydrogenase
MAGGPEQAASGELRFFVGAAPRDRALVEQLLAPLGTPFGEVLERPDQAQLVKLIANGLWFGQAVAVAEALLLGRAHGVDPQTTRALLAGSAAGSRFLDDYAGRMIAGDRLPAFGIDRVVEELDALEGVAGEAGVPHRIQALVAELHRETLAAYGPIDGELLAAAYLGLP